MSTRTSRRHTSTIKRITSPFFRVCSWGSIIRLGKSISRTIIRGIPVLVRSLPFAFFFGSNSLAVTVTYTLCLRIASCFYTRKARITTRSCARLETSQAYSKETRTTMMGRMTACNSGASRPIYALSLEHYHRTPHLLPSFLGPVDIASSSGTEIERLSRYPASLMCLLFHIKSSVSWDTAVNLWLLLSFNMSQNTPNPSLTTATRAARRNDRYVNTRIFIFFSGRLDPLGERVDRPVGVSTYPHVHTTFTPLCYHKVASMMVLLVPMETVSVKP